MSEQSNIEWTDATVNFWWGCTKVGPGCDHCYAEKIDARFGDPHWGNGVARRKIKGAVALLHRLDNYYADWAADAAVANGNARAFGMPDPAVPHRRRVFIQSMSDLFDLEVPVDWFEEAWRTIVICNRVDVQIVTKRISVVEKRLDQIGRTTWPAHAGLMVTVVNQAEADRDIPRLLALKSKFGIPWTGISAEPLLGPINLQTIDLPGGDKEIAPLGWQHLDRGANDDPRLDWVIVGGESGNGARPMQLDWARSIRDQCNAAGVAFFFKQWGQHAPNGSGRFSMVSVGKKAAGRLLDGREWNEMPKVKGFA